MIYIMNYNLKSDKVKILILIINRKINKIIFKNNQNT